MREKKKACLRRNGRGAQGGSCNGGGNLGICFGIRGGTAGSRRRPKLRGGGLWNTFKRVAGRSLGFTGRSEVGRGICEKLATLNGGIGTEKYFGDRRKKNSVVNTCRLTLHSKCR